MQFGLKRIMLSDKKLFYLYFLACNLPIEDAVIRASDPYLHRFSKHPNDIQGYLRADSGMRF